MNAKTKSSVTAPSRPPSTLRSKKLNAEERVNRSTSNATQPLEKASVRRKANADQTVLQKEGPDALPVSDYPLKEGLAANTLDKRNSGQVDNE